MHADCKTAQASLHALLKNVDFFATWCDFKAKAFDVLIPNESVTLTRRRGIHIPLRKGHLDHPELAII
jgi:hypothetical protein